MSYLFDNLESIGWKVFTMRERDNKQSKEECCCCERMLSAIVVLILNVKKKWLATMWNRNLRDCIYDFISAPIAFWTYLQLETRQLCR